MKKFISIIALLLCVCITSCDDENNATEELDIIASESSITAAEGEVKVILSTEADKAISDKEWCKPTLEGNLLRLTVDANTGLEGRTAKIEIIKGQRSLTYYVTQPGNHIPTAETEKIIFDAHGGSREISVNSSIPFTATSADSWLTVQVSENKLILSTSTNYTKEVLNTTVKLVSGSLESTLTVTQTGIELVPEKTSVVMYFAGDEQTIQVKSTLPFTAEAEDDSWLTVTNDEKSLTLTAPDNSEQPARSTKITLTSGELTATIDVTQRPPVYGDYLGNWNLTGEDAGTYNLNIVQDQAESTYKVTGWGKSIVATDSQYALTAYFDEETGIIFIPEQENLGTYNNQGTECPVVFYGKFLYGGSPSLYGGGEIVYLGLLMRDGSVQWLNGSFEFRGQKYDFLGGQYFLDTGGGRFASFNVDSPIMSNPKMTKAATRSAYRSSSVPDNGQDKTLSMGVQWFENRNSWKQTDDYGRILRDRLPEFLKRP